MKKLHYALIAFISLLFGCDKAEGTFEELNESKNQTSSESISAASSDGLMITQQIANDYWRNRNNPGFPNHWFDLILDKNVFPIVIPFLNWPNSMITMGSVKHLPFTITSPNGQYSFVGQNDGNLLVRRNSNGEVLWASNSNIDDYGGFYLILQNDGNLVLFKKWNSYNEEPIWATYNLQLTDPEDIGKLASNRPFYFMQNDGNLVLYHGFSMYLDDKWQQAYQAVAETQTKNRVSSHWTVIK